MEGGSLENPSLSVTDSHGITGAHTITNHYYTVADIMLHNIPNIDPTISEDIQVFSQNINPLTRLHNYSFFSTMALIRRCTEEQLTSIQRNRIASHGTKPPACPCFCSVSESGVSLRAGSPWKSWQRVAEPSDGGLLIAEWISGHVWNPLAGHETELLSGTRATLPLKPSHATPQVCGPD